MGHEGLRMAKESYKPEFMVKNIPLFLNNRGLYGFQAFKLCFFAAGGRIMGLLL